MEHHADLSKTHMYGLVCTWIPDPNKNKCYTVHRDAIAKELLELVFDEAYETDEFHSNVIDNIHGGLIVILLNMNIMTIFKNTPKEIELFDKHVKEEQIAEKLWNMFKKDLKDYPECAKVECQNDGVWKKETNTFNNMWNNLEKRMKKWSE